MTHLRTCLEQAVLQAILDGTLPQDEQCRVAAHLEACEDCRQAFESLAGRSGVISPEMARGASPTAGSQALEEAVRKLKDGADGPDASAAGLNMGPMSLQFLGSSENPQFLGRLGEYEVLEVIGRGGMGTVLKARDPKLERLVAVKVLNPNLACTAAARRRFLQEARSAASVAHEHVVTIHAVGDSGDMPFMVMEYVAGTSLEELIRQNGPLRLEEILRIGVQTASGLSAAHAQGLVHRDIKPGNILLENGVTRVKITDFGLVRVLHETEITQTDSVAGTPQYMSPEQALGDPLDHRSDLFSLGCVIYAMCVGRSPFRAETPTGVVRRVCEDSPRPVREQNPEIPEWLVAIIDRLLAKKPEDRFQSAGEIAKLLEQCLAHVREPSRVPLPAVALGSALVGRRGRRLMRRRGTIVAAAACLVLVLIAGIAQTEAKRMWPGPGPGKSQAGSLPMDQRKPGSMPPSSTIAPPPTREPLLDEGAKPDKSSAADPDKRQLDKLLEQDIRAEYDTANRYAVSGQWDLVAMELARLNEAHGDSSGNSRALAVAQLLAGDLDGYRATCAEAVRSLSIHGPYTKTSLVQICCLSPDSAIPKARIAKLLKEVDPQRISKSKLNQTMGFYFFRSGRDNEVLATEFPIIDRYQGCFALLLQAMANQRLDHREEAVRLLEEAVIRIQKDFPSPADPSGRTSVDRWVQWGILQLLLRESQKMIAPKKLAGIAAPQAASVAQTGQ